MQGDIPGLTGLQNIDENINLIDDHVKYSTFNIFFRKSTNNTKNHTFMKKGD